LPRPPAKVDSEGFFVLPQPPKVDDEGFFVLPPAPSAKAQVGFALGGLRADIGAGGESLPGGVGMERSVPPLTAAERERARVEGVRLQARRQAENTAYSMAHADYLNHFHYPTDQSQTAALAGRLAGGWYENTGDVVVVDGVWEPKIDLDQNLVDDPDYQDAYLHGMDLAASSDYFDYGRDPHVVEAGIPTGPGAGARAALRGAAAEAEGALPRVVRYAEAERRLPGAGQAHHIFQNAAIKDTAFAKLIDRAAGATVRLAGNVFKDQGSPHRVFHEAIEKFYDLYRTGARAGAPTIAEYSEAARGAFIQAGVKPDAARFLSDIGRRQLTVLRGVPASTPIRVPNRIGGL